MPHTLVVIRHAKSDWSVPVDDRHRPLAKRGRKQAPAAGDWLAAQDFTIEMAVVSPARRARDTWAAIAAHLPEPAAQLVVDEAAYTFDGSDLIGVVRALPDTVGVAALVSHNPAVEELAELLTGRWLALPTSALAVIEVAEWRSAGDGGGRLVAHGRPADGMPR